MIAGSRYADRHICFLLRCSFSVPGRAWSGTEKEHRGRGKAVNRTFAERLGKDIKGAILDIDGVLLNSLEIWKNLGRRYLKIRGMEAGEELEEVLESMSLEEGAAYLSSTYLLGISPSDVLSGLEEMLRGYYCLEVPAMPGAADFLAALRAKGLRITAATLSPQDLAKKALLRNGLKKYIEKIFTARETGAGKDSPDIYDAAAAFMGLERGEICVIEDSLSAVRTAAQAGYYTAWICGREESDFEVPCQEADICLRDLEEALLFIGAEGET